MALRSGLMEMFGGEFVEDRGVLLVSDPSHLERQSQTNDVFSDKWTKYSEEDERNQERLFDFQPGARDCNNYTMAIPLHNRMSEEDYQHVVSCLKEIR